MPPRLSGAAWQPCCRKAEIRTTCTETITNRGQALALLLVAHGECLGKTVDAIARYAKDDLATAYLIRAERNHDAVDLLRALETAKGFNRALAYERLRLTKEAIQAWDEAYKEGSDWSPEARQNRDRLLRQLEPMDRWQLKAEIERAYRNRDRAALTKIARALPADAERLFEYQDLLEVENARLFAEVLAEGGERYPLAIVEAVEHPRDRDALIKGLQAFRKHDDVRAAELLERAGNPLHLAARYQIAVNMYRAGENSLPLLDGILRAARPGDRDLAIRAHILRAIELETINYLEAHAAYKAALSRVRHDPTNIVTALGRRSANYATIGSTEEAFREAHRALTQSGQLADLNAIFTAYTSAAMAARYLGYARVALQYQNTLVELMRRAVLRASEKDLPGTKYYLASALRTRADIHIALDRDADAAADLTEAAHLADAISMPELQAAFQMRYHEVHAELLLKTNPTAAAAAFDEAIKLAAPRDSTYRAVLHFKRATARRLTGDPKADTDIEVALQILRDEARNLVDPNARAAYENLWTPYFSRFQDMHHQMIESRLAAGDVKGAFVYAEQARAFEPMQLLLQSRVAPAGFEPIETTAGLQRHLAALPEDTVILQYLVLRDKTYTWILTRGNIEVMQQSVPKARIEKWVADSLDAWKAMQRDGFVGAMRAAYAQLFRDPLMRYAPSKTRIVVVPDGPMHGLALAGLEGTKHEGYLIERASIATAASTSLYLYALARDRQFSMDGKPSVLLVGDPKLDPRYELPQLPGAKAEVEELARDHYRGADVLTGVDATIAAFLAEAKHATIVHFGGHAIANPQTPWKSRLLLAAGANAPGDLTAERLMQELSELERTRLVVLGACSTAGGHPVGPEGLASLVRPLVAANVPAVVGTLWDVKDATTRQLLVSTHCHYRRGDDVAVALRKAQLERLRNNDNPLTWAPFQVVGFAASPYPRPTALEEPSSDVCTENSLHRPDGLHSQ